MKRYLVAALVVLSSCKKNTGVEMKLKEDVEVDMTPIDLKGEVLFISRRIQTAQIGRCF